MCKSSSRTHACRNIATDAKPFAQCTPSKFLHCGPSKTAPKARGLILLHQLSGFLTAFYTFALPGPTATLSSKVSCQNPPVEAALDSVVTACQHKLQLRLYSEHTGHRTSPVLVGNPSSLRLASSSAHSTATPSQYSHDTSLTSCGKHLEQSRHASGSKEAIND